MIRKSLIALCGAVFALAGGPTTAALAKPGTKVTVRVEGAAHTLLAPKTIHTHAGSIAKGGAPKGACLATSGAGALDVATHHRWDGKYSASLHDFFITKILGEYESGTKTFWEIFVNNVAASTGACGLKLHRGDQLLFAAVSATAKAVYPVGLKGSHRVKVGKRLNLRVVYYDAKGKAHPLAGATVKAGSLTATSNSHGVVHFVPTHVGRLVVRANKTGYVRAAPLRVRVTK
jgi:hypothetical protein